MEILPKNDPPFTSTELDLVLQTLNPKVPGPDGLTAVRSKRETFIAITNKCRRYFIFPNHGKSFTFPFAHVVIILKSGKEEYIHPKSYQPILEFQFQFFYQCWKRYLRNSWWAPYNGTYCHDSTLDSKTLSHNVEQRMS